MNRKQLVTEIRTEAGELEAIVKKLQSRCGHLKGLADELEAAGAPPAAQNQKPTPQGKFRKLIDKVYGEKA